MTVNLINKTYDYHKVFYRARKFTVDVSKKSYSVSYFITFIFMLCFHVKYFN